MADTKTRTRDDAPATGGPEDTSALKKATEGIKAAFGKTADPPDQQAPASPPQAVSYAGSGTTEPHELNPATHGGHYRGPQGDV